MKTRILLKPKDKINDLTVINLDHIDKRHRRFFLCKCICGKDKVIQASLITSGNTKSCGCRVVKAGRERVLPNSDAAFTQTYNSYRCHAQERGLEFLISKKEFREVSQQHCYYCGSDLTNICKSRHKSGDFIHNGIDRIDSNKGYIKENIAACCKMCNIAKKDHTKNDFLMWVKKVYEYNAMANQ